MAKAAGHYGTPDTTSQGFGKLPSSFVHIDDYDLPVTDVDTARRNFPGFNEGQYCSIEDLQKGDTEGTTDSDSDTDPPYPGYTRLNKELTGGLGRRSTGGKAMGIGPMAAGFAAH
jgi:hypothetical protein